MDSTDQAKKKQWIVLKADDLVYAADQPHGLSAPWTRFLDDLERRGAVAGLGLIGNALETADSRFVKRIRELVDKSGHEIWNHGYDHALNRINGQGERYSEFQNTSYEHQLEHLQKTQRLALERLGLVLRTFNVPGNAMDANTVPAVEAVPEIKVWIFGQPCGKYVLERAVNVEHPVIRPNFEAFRKQFDEAADRRYLVLQVHPPHWTEEDFAQFARVMDYLETKPVQFMTPYGLYAAETGQALKGGE